MIWHLAFQTQSTEPALSQVKVHLLAQPPLRADAIAITHDQHADQYFGIDRGSASMAAIGGEMFTKFAQLKQGVGLSKHVVLGYVIFQAKLIKRACSDPAAAAPSSAEIHVINHRRELFHASATAGSFSTEYTVLVHFASVRIGGHRYSSDLPFCLMLLQQIYILTR